MDSTSNPFSANNLIKNMKNIWILKKRVFLDDFKNQGTKSKKIERDKCYIFLKFMA